jgi:alcohol dehydrogenase
MSGIGTTHRLLDGTAVFVRPIVPSDAQGLARFHQALSPESQRLRFFGFHPRLTVKELARFTTVDHLDREAFVVTAGSDILGVGRYDRVDGGADAEIAFATRDEHQGLGIATLLFYELAAAAKAKGITEFVADTLAENRKMRQLFADTGLVTSRNFSDGTVRVRMTLVTEGTFASSRPRGAIAESGSPTIRRRAMKALVYHGPGQKTWEDAPHPEITSDTDAIIRVDATTICGTDLHILKGDVPGVTDGRILGHEAVGTVDVVGVGVKTLKVGDRVLVSCITACGACRFCREGRYGQCLGGGGWILGNTIDGTQAEYVRVPFADTSTYQVPAGASDEQILMLADILPTGYEVGVLNGTVQPGDVVAVVGAGPIGLSAIMGARLFSPSHIVAVDLADSRLEAAKQFGADVTVNNSREDPEAIIAQLTSGLGADVTIEAVGVPATFELAVRLARPGGHIANIGVHGEPATLHLETLWSRDVTITTGLVDTYTTPTLLRLVTSQQIDAAQFVTHHFTLDQFEEAYDVFGRAAETGALKVVLTRA